MLAVRCGANSLVVTPETGAGVLGWMWGGVPILRRALPMAAVGGNPHTLGWFPLLPYANRIGGARFDWQGRRYEIARNFGDRPHAIHGIGWQRAWSVTSVATDHVVMVLEHAGDAAWPFGFEARIGYRVTADSVFVEMGFTNRHNGPAPAGLGLHPYFTKVHDARLMVAASGMWACGTDALPVRHLELEPGWQLGRAQTSDLDNCFTGWDRLAYIDAAVAGIRIEASDVFRMVQIFTPSWADFFCVEPVTHMPDALNRPDLPGGQAMHVLAPGDTLRGTIRMVLTR